MAEGFASGEGSVSPVIDPAEVDAIDFATRYDSEIEREIGKTAARLGIALNDVLQALNDRGSAEFHMSFHYRSTGTMDSDRTKGTVVAPAAAHLG